MRASHTSSASEVLRDATLTVSYTFNTTLLDDGPLGINGTGSSFQYTATGRVGDGLALTANPSFVEAAGLVYLGTDSYPFSVAIWIQPSSVVGGTIAHLSRTLAGAPWSIPMLGFTNAGNIAVQVCGANSSVSLAGPTVSVGVWTHVAITYSPSNKLRLWINGNQTTVSPSNFASSTIDGPVTMRLGASAGSAGVCASGAISMGQYFGLMDEFRLFSRELSASGVADLADP